MRGCRLGHAEAVRPPAPVARSRSDDAGRVGRGLPGRCEFVSDPAVVTLPYTCGELVQGRLEGVDFHVTCPIQRRGATVASWGNRAGRPLPFLPPKTRAAVGRVLGEAGGPSRDLRIQMLPQAPAGKGLASSSVDVLGAILAVTRLIGQARTASEASRMAVEVEPTDGIALPGIALFDHRRALWQDDLGPALPVGIIVLEPPAAVDTVAFHAGMKRLAPIERAGAGLWRDALAMVRAGLAAGEEAWLGAGATLSAFYWQRVLDNPWLVPAWAWGKQQGALGICRAHSGSVLGVLFASNRDLEVPAAALRALVPLSVRVWTTRLADGGPQ